MARLLSLLGLCFAILLVSGCKGKSGPAQVDVKGQVNLDGKPMPEGEVFFFVPGEAPGALEVKSGSFSGKAKEGLNKVEVRTYKMGPPLSTDPEKKPTKINILPSRYNDKSTLTADVKPGGANEFKFDVTSK